MRLRKKETILFLGFVVLFLLGYYRTFGVGFLSDGFGFINQCRVEGTELFQNNFHDYFYLPLTHTIAFGEYQIFGSHAIGFRIVQYLMHIINAWMLFIVLRNLLKRTVLEEHNATRIALFAGALFLIHPYQTEGVVWLASRAYIWTVFFSLLATWFWMRYTEEQRKKFLVGSLLAFTAALFCKESALVLPVILWGFEIIRERRLFPAHWRTLSLMLLPVGVYLSARFYVLDSLIGGYGDTVHIVSDPGVWLTHAMGYFAKFFLGYRYLHQFVGSEGVWWVAGIVALLGVLHLYISRRYKWKLPFFERFGWRVMIVLLVLVLVALLPVLSLEMTSLGSIQSDRYSYFPMLMVAVAIVWMAYLLSGKYLPWVMGSVLAVCLLFTWKTNEAWQKADDLTDTAMQSLVEQVGAHRGAVVLINTPDNFRGAYMLRNKINDAFQLRGGGAHLISLTGIEMFDEFEGVLMLDQGDHWVAETSGYARFVDVNTHPDLQFHQKRIVIPDSLLNAAHTDHIYYYDGGTFRKLGE